MTTELPFPLTLRLPDGWEWGDPDVVGAPTAAFIARRPVFERGLAPTVLIDGEWTTPDADLEAYADASLRAHATRGNTVRRVELRPRDPEAGQGLVHLMAVLMEIDGVTRSLFQQEVYVLVPDTTGTAAALLRFIFTATRRQYVDVGPDFLRLIDSVALDGRADPRR